MEIQFEIDEENRIRLCIFEGRKKMDCIEWQDRNDLSRKLLANLSKILRKNERGVDKISEYKIISKVPKKWTSFRIAEMTLKSLLIGGLAEKRNR